MEMDTPNKAEAIRAGVSLYNPTLPWSSIMKSIRYITCSIGGELVHMYHSFEHTTLVHRAKRKRALLSLYGMAILC